MTTSDINNATANTTDSQTLTDGAFTISNGVAELALPAGMTDLEVGSLPKQFSYNSVVIKGNDLNNTITLSYSVTTSVTLRGGAGNDQLAGQRGNDTLDGGSGADTMRGGEGSDTYHVDDVGDVIIEVDQAPGYRSNDPGFDTVISALNYTLSDKNLEHLTLVGGATKGMGNELRNELRAGTLGASLSGLAGDDLLVGGKGNDTLDGGDGNDVYVASAGIDLLVDEGATGLNTLELLDSADLRDVRFSRSGLDLVVQYNATPDAASPSVTAVQNYFDKESPLVSARWRTVSGYTDNTLGSLVDVANTIALGDGDDVLQLDQGNGIVLAGAGNDLISIFKNASVIAGAGNDTVDGHGEMGFIEGDEGNDSIWGASSLYGGAGDDYLGVVVNTRLADGGAGNNTYKLGDGSRYLTIKSSDDTSVNTIRFQPGPNGLAARPEDIQISGQGETYIDLHQAGTSTYANVQMTAGQTWQVAFDNGVVWKAADLIALTHTATEGKDTLLGLSGNDTLSGKGGDDYITGATGNDLLSGDEGNDALSGNEGNDTLIGGAGNDSLFGGEGNDTFVVGRQGNDVIESTLFASSQDLDVLQFTDGIKASDVSISVANEYSSDYADLTLTYQGGSVVLSNFVTERRTGASAQFKEFVFADGERWDQARLQTLRSLGTNNNDVLVASASGGLIEGLGGDDVLIAKNGAATLLGGAGNDTLNANYSSATTLRGGTGNDSIAAGGEQADRVYFDIGDGHDIIDLGAGDTVVFGPGLSLTDLSLEVLPVTTGANRFKLSFGLNESLTLSTNGGSYNPETLPLVNFEFSDGSTLTGADLLKLNPGYKFGSGGADVVQGTNSTETLLGLGGKDTLIGGQGNDTVIGGMDVDTIVFNRGDGADVVLTIESDKLSASYYSQGAAPDVLSLGAGIRPDDLVFSKVEGGYQVKVLSDAKDVGDSITILAPGLEYTSLVFADGHRYNKETIGLILDGYIQPGGSLIGTQGNDTLVSYQGATQVQGLGGNDRIVVGPSDDTIDGGAGDDTLVIKAAMSFDTYESHGDAAGDVIELSDGFNLSDFAIVLAEPTAGSTDATMNLWRKDGEGALTIVDRLAPGQSRATPVSGLPGLRQSDGTFFSVADLYARRQQGTAGSDTLYGGNIAGVVLDGGAGADTFVISGMAKDVKVKADASDTIDLTKGPARNTFSAKVIEQDGKAQLSFRRYDTDKVFMTLLDAEAALDTNVRMADGQATTVRALAGQYITAPYPSVSATLQGWFGNDTINGGFASETLIGRDGDDRMYAGDSPDTLIGGLGSDLMEGGYGVDTYLYDRGDGQDTLVAEKVDIIQFGAGISSSDLVVAAAGATAPGAVVVQIGRPDGLSTDSITLKDASAWEGLRFRFADGTEVVGSSGLSLSGSLVGAGTQADDVINGTHQNDTLMGLAGSDVLTGGKGNDLLEGGTGVDRYNYSRGDGADVIRINSGDWRLGQAADDLVFGAGIRMDDLQLSVVTGGYQINVLQSGQVTGDSINVLTSSSDALDINFADGNVWAGGEVAAYVSGAIKPGGTLRGTDSDDNLLAFQGNSSLFGQAGNDVLRGQGGNDMLDGGTGNDSLYGGGGDDLLKTAAGAHVLDGGQGDDRFYLGTSRDVFNDTIRADGSDQIFVGIGSNIQWTVDRLGTSGPGQVVVTIQEPFVIGASRITLLDAGQWDGLKLNLGSDVIITGAQIMALATKPEDLTLTGTAGSDNLDGKDGNDTLLGLAGDDIIRGGTGRDRFEGGAGDDWLVDQGGIAFVGQNRVYGSGGADTYVYNLGDGKDIVVDSSLSTDEDVLQFGAGIALSDIGVVRRKLSTSELAIPSPDEALPKFFHNDEVFVVKGQGEVAFRSTGTDIRSVGETVSAGNWNVERLQFSDGTSLDRAGIEALFVNAATDQTGSGANDTLLGKDGNDTLSGRVGNDTLKGGAGTDWLSGGKGSDVLDGGAGADTYAYSRGDGPDTLLADGQDTVVFDLGIRQADLLVGKLGASAANTVDVLIRNGSTSTADMLTLVNASSLAGLQLKFADGSSLTGAEILAIATKPDNLMLDGTTKADKLTGKDGNDTLSGLAGNDTLAGGKGNDSLIGGKGNDTYLFNRGDGQDLIVDTDSALFNSDLLKLGGATSKQLWLTKAGNNLDIKILGTSDKVTVQNWFAGSSNRVEKITASDGKSLSASKVQSLVNAMASFTPPADAASLPANAPAALTKLVASSWA